jgi:hypothetical protein
MGRKSTFENYRGKVIRGIQILEKLDIVDGRLNVKCRCIPCGKEFIDRFHNVYGGNRRSCGCLVKANKKFAIRWQGVGEIGKSYFTSLKKGAESRGLVFGISLEWIWELFLKQEKKCAFSGDELRFSDSRKILNGTASLDRINPKIGYTKDNVQWVRQDLKYMKQEMNVSEFLEAVKKIAKYRNL